MATNPPKRQAPKPNSSVIQWLLDSDPSIRWQVMRDLIGAPAEEVAAERARVATEGWGARLLALQGADGSWAGEAWNHGWDSTMHVLSLLREMGLDPASDEARRAVGLVRDRVRWRGWDWDGTWRGLDFVGNPFFAGEVEPCINGQVAASGAYFGLAGYPADHRPPARRAAARRRLELRGRATARRGRRSTPRSACWKPCSNTNWPVGGANSAEVREARLRGQEYLLERRLLRRLSTGEVIDSGLVTRFSFPTWWHYDVLRGLEYLRRAGATPDERVAEAIELVESKRDGDGRWPLENQHPGTMPVEMDEGEGRPSRWNTLRALRVLDWYSARD